MMAQRFEKRGKWSDYAILYRGNHQARIFEEKLRAEHIPICSPAANPFSNAPRSRTSSLTCA